MSSKVPGAPDERAELEDCDGELASQEHGFSMVLETLEPCLGQQKCAFNRVLYIEYMYKIVDQVVQF